MPSSCPASTGKSFLIFRNRVKPHLQKYFSSPLTQIRCISKPSRAHRGASAIVTDVARDAVDARASGAKRQSQGEMNLVSGQPARRMIGAFAYGQVVWFGHPFLE